MRLPDFRLPLLMFLLTAASSGWAADFLYTPQPADGTTAEGVLVREITVKKGDTLSHISKQYAGRGHYYPQILLFNEIKNPHRIKPGQVVRVPLSSKAAKTASAAPAPSAGKDRRSQPAATTPTAVENPQKPEETQDSAGRSTSKAERHAYQRAAAAYKKGDCENAIKLYDAFSKRYPSSALLPEASLNRADCYLKLSAQ